MVLFSSAFSYNAVTIKKFGFKNLADYSPYQKKNTIKFCWMWWMIIFFGKNCNVKEW